MHAVTVSSVAVNTFTVGTASISLVSTSSMLVKLSVFPKGKHKCDYKGRDHCAGHVAETDKGSIVGPLVSDFQNEDYMI